MGMETEYHQLLDWTLFPSPSDFCTKSVCNAADLADGQVKSISALGTELVAFRGADGKVGGLGRCSLSPWDECNGWQFRRCTLMVQIFSGWWSPYFFKYLFEVSTHKWVCLKIDEERGCSKRPLTGENCDNTLELMPYFQTDPNAQAKREVLLLNAFQDSRFWRPTM
jgi:hypothetical protein